MITVDDRPMFVVEGEALIWSEEHVIDWFDDSVQTFVRHPSGQWLYCAMVAWDVDGGLRAFVAIAVEAETVEGIAKRVSEENGGERTSAWHELTHRVEEMWVEHSGKVWVFACAHLGETVLRVAYADKGTITLPSSIDDIVDAQNVRHWLTVLGLDTPEQRE